MQPLQFMKLKGLRIENGLTQKDVAKKLGISNTSYYEKENGFRPFTLWEAERIMIMFGRKYEDIFARNTGEGVLK